LLAGSAVIAGILSWFVLRGTAGKRQRVLITMTRFRVAQDRRSDDSIGFKY